MKATPKISASAREAATSVREGVSRFPTVMHAKNEIRKAKIGAKYHCGAIACDLLIKASAVVITA
jgi:hypothetical protein